VSQLQDVIRGALDIQLLEARQKIEQELAEREEQLLKKEEELKERLASSTKRSSELSVDSVDHFAEDSLTSDKADGSTQPVAKTSIMGGGGSKALKKTVSLSVVPEFEDDAPKGSPTKHQAKNAWPLDAQTSAEGKCEDSQPIHSSKSVVRFSHDSTDDEKPQRNGVSFVEHDDDESVDGKRDSTLSETYSAVRPDSKNSWMGAPRQSQMRPSLFGRLSLFGVGSEAGGGGNGGPRSRATRRVSAIARNRTTHKDLKFNEKTRGKVFEDDHHSKGNLKVAAFIHNTYFETGVTMLIIANSVLIGAQSDWTASKGREKPMPEMYKGGELFFCVVFTLELTLRIIGEGSNFLNRKNIKFHLLDTLIVVSALVEQIMLAASVNNSAGENLAIFSVLRILRLVRVARSVRLMQFSRDLRALVHGMVYCVKPLVWAVILLTLIMFMFSVVLMEFAVDEFTPKEWYDTTTSAPWSGIFEDCNGDSMERILQEQRKRIAADTMPHTGTADQLRWYFGHLPRSMYTLFKAISGGETWGEVAEPLKNVSWSLVIFFCVYIGVVVFAVLNIVTSIFIENARKNALHDKDNLIWEEVQERNWQGDSLKNLFVKADVDKSGTIDWLKFRIHFEDPIVQAYLRTLGIDVQACGVDTFFDMLDFDDTRQIDLETFMAGCLHFRGAARSIDVERLSHKLRDLEQNLNDSFIALARALGAIDTSGIVKSKDRSSTSDKRPSWMTHS
jgi:hypothetical protein